MRRDSRERLSKVFNQIVRDDPDAASVFYKNLETSMYRARIEIKPPIHGSPVEFCQLIPSSKFGIHYKGEELVGCDIEVIFFSDRMTATLSEVEEIYFDGTFTQYLPISINFGQFLPALDATY